MKNTSIRLRCALQTLICAMIVSTSVSCNKEEDVFSLMVNPSSSENVIVRSVDRDENNGTAVISITENGTTKDTTVVVPLGGVRFNISPKDTIVADDASVISSSFNQTSSNSRNYEDSIGEMVVYYTSTIKTFVHDLNKYSKDIEISYLDAYCYVWGVRIDFPKANGNVSYANLSVVNDGQHGNASYFLSTTNYNVNFMESSRVEKGYEELTVADAADPEDRLISVTKTDEGFEVIAHDANNNPIRSRSWIEVTRTYSVSGAVTSVYEVILNNNVTAPAYSVVNLNSFSLTQVNASLGNATLNSQRTEGNIAVKKYTRTYTVGNNQFTKNFVLSYETARWSDGTYSFDMPSAEYTNISDNGFTMTNMTGSSTYDAKLNTHRMSARFNGESVNAKVETEVRVAVTPEDEDPRITPSWLGNPVGAKYTRVQRTTGQQFMDMIVFEYQNGVVMAPNGIVDTNLIYAFNQSVASAHGVDWCLRSTSNIHYSGVWTGSKWAPASIVITNGRWIYAGRSSSWDHTVMENNAITLGIGVDVTPAPSAQNVSISNGTITISYAVNNGSWTATSSCSLQ